MKVTDALCLLYYGIAIAYAIAATVYAAPVFLVASLLWTAMGYAVSRCGNR